MNYPWLRSAPWLALGLFLMMGLVGDKGVLRWWQIRQDAAALENQLKLAQSEGAQLEFEAESLKRDPRAVERAAREDLNMVRDNEILYRFDQ